MAPLLGNLRGSPDRDAALTSYRRQAPVNLWKLWRSRHHVSTYRGLHDPAAALARRCPDWRIVATRVQGTSYPGAGHLAPPPTR